MSSHQDTFAKRRRELQKKQKAAEKRERRQQRKEQAAAAKEARKAGLPEAPTGYEYLTSPTQEDTLPRT